MDISRATELLAALADGTNPFTGEVLPDDCVCNQAEMVRAFHTILSELTVKSKKTASKPANAGKPWTDEDEEVLILMYDDGKSRKEICEHFNRSAGAIAARLVRLGKIRERDEFRAK